MTDLQTFESAFSKLEELIHKMEDGKLALEDSIQSFEEGMQLVQFCEQKLNEANGKIEKWIHSLQGDREKVPFDPTSVEK